MRPQPGRVGDGPWTRRILIGLGLAGAVLLLGAPVALVLARAFAEGIGVYWSKVSDPFTLRAIGLTVLSAVVVVPINTLFGLAAAWAITRHRFPGRGLMMTLIEAPISISPIVAGVALLFLYGAQGVLGPWLIDHGIRVMFTVPAIFLASLFVTSPFVARTLITAMSEMGQDDEEAAVSMGASSPALFARVLLPKIRLPLLYGVMLCNARVLGEFGAVSVVSGKIRGVTNTLPLQIELLFNDYNTVGAFAAASLLTLMALATLAGMSIWDLKTTLNRRGE
jgi:sulfate transport system permease protein